MTGLGGASHDAPCYSSLNLAVAAVALARLRSPPTFHWRKRALSGRLPWPGGLLVDVGAVEVP